MAPKFGTSGLRGLVAELTPDCISQHVLAFAAACPMGQGLLIGHDLRSSSPEIARMVADSGQQAGLAVNLCGAVPTPALALSAMEAGSAAIMITGSHIPADRNGLKFYTPAGEITKAQEEAITKSLGAGPAKTPGPSPVSAEEVMTRYHDRYLSAYADALRGQKIGIYAHSAVGREGMADLISALGAEVVTLGWSDSFVPVDTEAVAPELRHQLRIWAKTHDCDAIVSTDGDGDRPLLTDERGEIVPGDILGQITAAEVGAKAVVTPISSNTGVDSGDFETVLRTRIGSPFVIAGMAQVGSDVVGYEANGGFLLGFSAKGATGNLAPLMTRDAVLPIIAVLAAARNDGVAARVAAEPSRFTAADRLQDVPTERSQDLVMRLATNADARSAFANELDGHIAKIDQTDGLRMTLLDGRIVHLRPSGNAPELRLYVEADDPRVADKTLNQGLVCLQTLLKLIES